MAVSREPTQIRIGGRKEWVMDIEESKLMDISAESKHWTNHSIYLVPSCIKIHNRQAYKPQVVSFGPYHHGDENLLPMEDHKNRALLHFVRRTGRPLEEFVVSIEGVLPKLIAAYERLSQEWTDDGGDRFLKLMIVDGFFMLELLLFSAGKHGDYAVNDPIFSSHGMLYMIPYIRRDMLMIENQIPLLVLEKLLSVAHQDGDLDLDINNLALSFCAPGPWAYPRNAELCLHPLDVVRKNMLRGPIRRNARPHLRTADRSSSGEGDIVRSAVELNEAGVLFRRSSTTSFRDISFRHGVLRLPEIVVDDSTESLLLNLMAFERLHVGAGSEVTSYVFFMDNIIDSSKDVSLLHAKGIIQNALGSDKAVAKLFNTLCKDVTLDPDSNLEFVRRRVNNYCSKPWNMWRANLIHTYFRSPWAFMSLLAAIVLLGLTVAQTVFTILS